MDGYFVDCHCHMSANEFAQRAESRGVSLSASSLPGQRDGTLDLDDVIDRAKHARIKALITVTESASEFERVIQLSKIYAGLVFPCFGVHPLQGFEKQPHSVRIQDLEPALPLLQMYRDNIVAVGEIGLDFTLCYVSTVQEREEQLLVFKKQLEISKALDLPVNVHSRSAVKVVVTTMKEHGIRDALLHNFAGRWSVAQDGLQAGYYFSFPPAVSTSHQRDKLIKQIPLERICLETDSPALGPVKHVRNEPKNLTLSCEYIAKVKGISYDVVAEITTQNSLYLFPKLKM